MTWSRSVQHSGQTQITVNISSTAEVEVLIDKQWGTKHLANHSH